MTAIQLDTRVARSERRPRFDDEAATLFTVAYRVSYGALGNRADAEDVAQEVLIRVNRKWATVWEYADNWTARVATNLAIDTLRKRKHTTEMASVESADDPDTAMRIDLQRAIESLGPRQREVIILHYFGGMSFEAIAAELGCSIGAVKKYSHRAIGHLRNHLGDIPDLSDEELDEVTRIAKVRGRRRVAAIAAACTVAALVLAGGIRLNTHDPKRGIDVSGSGERDSAPTRVDPRSEPRPDSSVVAPDESPVTPGARGESGVDNETAPGPSVAVPGVADPNGSGAPTVGIIEGTIGHATDVYAANPGVARLSVVLRRPDADGVLVAVASAVVATDGSFRIENVPTGTYVVGVRYEWCTPWDAAGAQCANGSTPSSKWLGLEDSSLDVNGGLDTADLVLLWTSGRPVVVG